MNKRRKVYIVGIDGATFRILDRLIARGRLPTFASIMERGVRGVLRSTVPANSAVAWSTFMTGKNPGKHGVFGFLALAPDGQRLMLTNGGHVKSKTIWEIASGAHRRVAVINVPLTYPPRRVNGALVSGMDASFLKEFTFPATLGSELLRLFPNYAIDLPFVRHASFQAVVERRAVDLIDVRRRAMFYLLEKIDPDLFVGVFTTPDRLQHHFWHVLDPTHPRHEDDEPEGAGILSTIYERLDEALGGFLERMDDQTTLLIISDHGFGGVARRFLVNRWLSQMGWLHLKEAPRDSAWARLLRTVKRHPRLYESARWMKRRLPGAKHVPLRQRLVARSFFDKVDWSRTRAYYFPPGIRLNLKGREPCGAVEAGEFESAREELIVALSGLREPLTGEPVFKGVYRKEEIYAGPHLDRAPDIILDPMQDHDEAKRNVSLGRRLRRRGTEDVFVTDGPTGDHASEGILLGVGRLLKSGYRLHGATIADIAPTVLYGLGLPIPVDMDGRVLTEMFISEFAERHPPQFCPGEDASWASEWQYDQSEEAVIRERLRDLGYLS